MAICNVCGRREVWLPPTMGHILTEKAVAEEEGRPMQAGGVIHFGQTLEVQCRALWKGGRPPAKIAGIPVCAGELVAGG